MDINLHMILTMDKCLCLLLLVSATLSVPTEDQVHIPSLNYSYSWYSGYLNFTTGNFHYVFFQSQSNPANDPLVLWLNGGPGCSSLIGMLYENGPFKFKLNTTTLQPNPYSWNKRANILYLESPGGVGFSEDKRSFNNNDGTVAVDNYLAMVQFFKKFPNYLRNDFYLTGQSYAGIYIPYMANEILNRNKLPSREITIRLVGVLIGNACTDPRQCYEPNNDINLGVYQYEFMYFHGYITLRDWDVIQGACWLNYRSDACSAVRKPIDAAFYASKTSLLNIYAPCMNQPLTHDYKSSSYSTVRQGSVSCEDSIGIHTFLNTPSIRSALHVKQIQFSQCSDMVGDRYQMFSNASYWLYPIMIQAKLRVWVMEGDVDLSVPITGTERWIKGLKQDKGLTVVEAWREWWVPGEHRYEDQVGGMTWKLKGFTFASIRGAGHLVPKDKPREAQIIFNAFINNQDLPKKQM